MDNFNNKVNEAAAKFLTHRGYDIVEETWKREGGMLPVDIVATEDETVVFVSTKGRNAEKGCKFDDGNLDRSKLEAFAVKWFTEHVDEIGEGERPYEFCRIGEDWDDIVFRTSGCNEELELHVEPTVAIDVF